MRKITKSFTSCTIMAISVALGFGLNAAVADQATTTPVLKTDLMGVDGTEANIVEFDVGAGWETERHTHPGHVFVYMQEGSILVDVDGKEPQTYTAGDAFYELPDKPMTARTASADEGARFIVFQVGPTGEPIMVPHSD
ncbi:cupin domain-containing protein [Paracoccus methylarcula]|nr:cupin domain-containing protein [Paracoccus methylarcula]